MELARSHRIHRIQTETKTETGTGDRGRPRANIILIASPFSPTPRQCGTGITDSLNIGDTKNSICS